MYVVVLPRVAGSMNWSNPYAIYHLGTNHKTSVMAQFVRGLALQASIDQNWQPITEIGDVSILVKNSQMGR